MPSSVILPPKNFLNASIIQGAVNKSLYAVALEIKKDYETIVATWKNKPVFLIQKVVGGYEVTAQSGKASDIFGYVSRGTEVRHAVMSKNFVPKTYERQIFSAPGAGGKVFVSKKIKLKGIKGRKFEEAIRQKYESGKAARLFQETLEKELAVLNYG